MLAEKKHCYNSEWLLLAAVTKCGSRTFTNFLNFKLISSNFTTTGVAVQPQRATNVCGTATGVAVEQKFNTD